MTTREDGNFVTDIDVVHAYGTFSLTIATHHALIDFLFRESVNGFDGGRTGGGSAMGLLHELCNDAVKGFFSVDSITVSRVVGIKKVSKEVDGGDGSIDALSILPHLMMHAIDALE